MTRKSFKSLILIVTAALTVAFCVPQGRAQATAPQAASTLAGKWHFALDTDGGPREVEAEFAVDGQKVTGKWGTADVKGTVADGKLALEFPYDSDEAGPGTMKITGTLVGDGIAGTWAFQSYDGTFKASRKP